MAEQDDREMAMESLYDSYARTPVLAELANGRRLVRGYGPLPSPLVVVGEAPGAEEERRGRPFVGPSGLVLQDLFRRAGVPWNFCYVTNTVSWRPPGNRTPYPFQVQASCGRLEYEIELVEPQVVVTAGAVAWRGVTRNALGPFEEARFKWHELHGRQLLALPHPAYLLRLGKPGTLERDQWEQATVDALVQVMAA